ncbi:MAG TPA: hypothetical protein VFT78_09715 [Hanamia sp.]|nr:hypothetical protein [Hanamia sp.]
MLRNDEYAYNNGFCASGAEGINLSIFAAIISSSGQTECYQQTNK